MELIPDQDPQETAEWLAALDGVLTQEGPDRAHFLIEALIDKARRSGAYLPFSANTAYINTIPVDKQVKLPGDFNVEQRIRHYVRWNSMAMVLRANKDTNVGGHIASFASAATLYDVGFNHFWHAPSAEHGGDLVFIQGHSAPGIYARAFMLDRLTPEQMDNFRQEVDGKGISSYPHPWLMPDFWQFPTVSMGLGPLMAIYQARFMKYLHDRAHVNTEGRTKVWCFCGDGEMDEPESMGAIGMAGRENLDNLIFVVNCNLQRLDGPSARQRQDHPGAGECFPRRGLERPQGDLGPPLGSAPRARQEGHPDAPDDGSRRRRVPDVQVEGRRLRARAFLQHRCGVEALEPWSPTTRTKNIWTLNRGGHDPFKVYAAFHAAVNHKDQPTVILAKENRSRAPRHGRVGRGAKHHPPAEEDVARIDQELPRPLPHSGHG